MICEPTTSAEKWTTIRHGMKTAIPTNGETFLYDYPCLVPDSRCVTFELRSLNRPSGTRQERGVGSNKWGRTLKRPTNHDVIITSSCFPLMLTLPRHTEVLARSPSYHTRYSGISGERKANPTADDVLEYSTFPSYHTSRSTVDTAKSRTI
jgi:hypothetical protein